MADDGMLVNFAVDNAVFKKAPPKFKGGSWRDRVALNRRVRNGGSRRPPLPLSGTNQTTLQSRKGRDENVDQANADFPQPRTTKRRKQDRGFATSNENFRPSTKVRDEAPDSALQRPHGDREVISSLFSYNPKPSTAPSKEEPAESETAKPSNAPLIDGLDTFTTLGLSPTLAAHLLTKLELKDPTAIQKAAITQLLKEEADAFIQSETGSGKTLAYLLPLVQRIMTLSIDGKQKAGVQRDSGLFAMILAPTRELCKQISVVLERLLGCAHWIVAGTVIGGERKKSEKARLRKGLNILVATPGRLADHLDNTKVLDISYVRWLVLDEGDRLMDLGFEDEIQKIVAKLDERQKANSKIVGLPSRRTTILCSATMKMNVQRLGEISLKDATLIKGETSTEDDESKSVSKDQAFLAPAQLKQSYTVVPAKLRLVTLIALLKRTFARKGSVMKAIIFCSCADSVDFHFSLFSQPDLEDTTTSAGSQPQPTAAASTQSPPPEESAQSGPSQTSSSMAPSPLLSSRGDLTIYKLHGSLPQKTRTHIVNTFSRSTTPSLLISTDVASRGLDLPNLDLVIEYDPAFSSEDHLHRIGRTARLGRDGRAMIFLLPGAEESYVEILQSSYRDTDLARRALSQMSNEEILKRGFSSSITANNNPSSTTTSWEDIATNIQLAIERRLLSHSSSTSSSSSKKPTTTTTTTTNPQPTETGNLHDLAIRAYKSHIRAYATHTSSERKYFDIKTLHLGHLAKAFGLRDRPSGLGHLGSKRTATAAAATSGKKRVRSSTTTTAADGGNAAGNGAATPGDIFNDDGDGDVEDETVRKKKMRTKMKETMMMGTGAGEFNIA